ncbi:MAG: hypothetical protein AUG44_06700 [Actinobacteria bacterium 13_1_20CM_3_71_11]|nr:MAG: hypothetical protein AUG44_06700 [Actinobacteria bacterium 13_1_20CM_3_71_11]
MYAVRPPGSTTTGCPSANVTSPVPDEVSRGPVCRRPSLTQSSVPDPPSSTHSRPWSSMLAAWVATSAAMDTGPPRRASVRGSASASTPRPASRAYTAPGPAKARRSAPAPGIGETAPLTANVAPSTRRSVPADRLTAYAVDPCCTTSRASPGVATRTCAATSTEEPSSSVS